MSVANNVMVRNIGINVTDSDEQIVNFTLTSRHLVSADFSFLDCQLLV